MVAGTAMSDTSPIYCGVPHGSVLGTVLFWVPTGTIEECVGDIRHWMGTYLLALNDSKTEVIMFSTKCCGHDPGPSRDLHVGGVSISLSNGVCNLGVIMDSAGTMSNHVSRLRRSASFA